MTRPTVAVDRLAAALCGLALVALGVLSVGWGTDRLPGLPGSLELGPAVRAADQTWWPWAVGIGGGVLVLVALRWLAAHLPRRGGASLRLGGTDATGRLVADAGSAVDAAASVLGAEPGIRSARGRVLRERGRVVAQLDVVLDGSTALRPAAEAAERTTGELVTVLGRPDVRCRVVLAAPRRAPRAPRVL